MENTATILRSTLVASALSVLLGVACRPRDPEIAESVRSKVSTFAQGISVEVRDGVATLTGEVADSSMRSSVEGTAKGVLGVRSVVNLVRVAQALPVARTPEALREAIAGALEGQGIRGVTVDVDTSMVATLSGYIDIAQDSLALRLAREAGASGVVDRMRVVK
jgi:osmotically-inducible protein OsmY